MTIPIAFCAILLLIYRALLGVDFTDESFHIATAYHFALGAKAFVDTTSTGQTFGFITLPLLKLVMALNHSTEYLVLKMRLLFILFYGLLGLVSYRALISSNLFSRSISFISCLILFICIPMNIFSLFYVNLGVIFVGLSICLLAPQTETKNSSHTTLIAGLFLGLATIAHPSIFLCALFIIIFRPRDRGLFLVGFSFVWTTTMLIFRFSPFDYLNSILSTRETLKHLGAGLSANRIVSLGPNIIPRGPLFEVWIIWILFFLFSIKKKVSSIPFALLLIFPVIIFLNSRARYGGQESPGYLLCLAYTSPIFCYFVHGWIQTRKYVLAFWAPCFLVFIGFSLVSTAGVASTSAGFLPVLPFSFAFLVAALNKANPWKPIRNTKILTAYILLFFGFLFCRNLLQSAYREVSMSELTRTVSIGPFRGLKTTEFKANFIESLQKDLEGLPKESGNIVFSCLFPGGYLLTGLFPNHDNLWFSPSNQQIKSNTHVVVRLYDTVYPKLNIWQQHCDPLPELIGNKKGSIIHREHYEIWVQKIENS